MPSDTQVIGNCPQCNGPALTCKYNHFESGDLVIDSWEHRCPDCGHRDTTAFRSDDDEASPPGTPAECPYCQRRPGTH